MLAYNKEIKVTAIKINYKGEAVSQAYSVHGPTAMLETRDSCSAYTGLQQQTHSVWGAQSNFMIFPRLSVVLCNYMTCRVLENCILIILWLFQVFTVGNLQGLQPFWWLLVGNQSHQPSQSQDSSTPRETPEMQYNHWWLEAIFPLPSRFIH